MRGDEGFGDPWPLGVCKSLSDVLSFLNSRAYRPAAGGVGRSAAVAGTPSTAEQRAAGGHGALPGYRRDGGAGASAAQPALWTGGAARTIWCGRASEAGATSCLWRSRAADARPSLTPGHILQLAAYCLLVEDNFDAAPPYGLLRYADATLQIPYTDELRRRVLDTAAEIRQARRAPDVPRSHSEPPRCAACGYRSACGSEALN